MTVDSIKRALPSALGVTQWQGCKAAGEQSRGWSGGSAKDRGPEDSCVDRGAQMMAVRAEGPRSRDWLAACRLALSEWDFSD